MARYSVTIQAEDGRHARTFATAERAAAYVAKQIGRPVPVETVIRARTYYDDWGRALYLSVLPDSVATGAQVERLHRAYDARECGTATAAQLRMLEKHGH